MLMIKKNGNNKPKYANHANFAGFTNVAKNANTNKMAKKMAKLLNSIQTKLRFFLGLKCLMTCKVTKKIVILQILWENVRTR